MDVYLLSVILVQNGLKQGDAALLLVLTLIRHQINSAECLLPFLLVSVAIMFFGMDVKLLVYDIKEKTLTESVQEQHAEENILL